MQDLRDSTGNATAADAELSWLHPTPRRCSNRWPAHAATNAVAHAAVSAANPTYATTNATADDAATTSLRAAVAVPAAVSVWTAAAIAVLPTARCVGSSLRPAALDELLTVLAEQVMG